PAGTAPVGTAPSAEASSAPATASGPDTHVALASGAAGVVHTAGDVAVQLTLESVADPAISSNRFETPGTGNRFVAYIIQIENVGTKEGGSGDWKLRTRDGFEYTRKYVTVSGVASNYVTNLTSGGKARTAVVFEIPEGAAVQWVKFDPNSFSKG